MVDMVQLAYVRENASPGTFDLTERFLQGLGRRNCLDVLVGWDETGVNIWWKTEELLCRIMDGHGEPDKRPAHAIAAVYTTRNRLNRLDPLVPVYFYNFKELTLYMRQLLQE